jgi:hypothetical protein
MGNDQCPSQAKQDALPAWSAIASHLTDAHKLQQALKLVKVSKTPSSRRREDLSQSQGRMPVERQMHRQKHQIGW